VYTSRRELPNRADVCHVEIASLVECDATGRTQPGGGEVAQVYTSRRELPNRVAIDVGDVEIAVLVKGQAGGPVQPGGGEVAQVCSARRELPNRVGALVGDKQVLCLRRRGQVSCPRGRDGEAERREKAQHQEDEDEAGIEERAYLHRHVYLLQVLRRYARRCPSRAPFAPPASRSR